MNLLLFQLWQDNNEFENQRQKAIEEAKRQIYNEIKRQIDVYRSEELKKLEQEKQKQLQEFEKMEKAIKLYESKIDNETIKELEEIKKQDYELFILLRRELAKDLSLRVVEGYENKKELQKAREEFLKEIEKAKQEINKEFDRIIQEEYNKFLESDEYRKIVNDINRQIDEAKQQNLILSFI